VTAAAATHRDVAVIVSGVERVISLKSETVRKRVPCVTGLN
jgi:hypothetical protein